MNFCDIQKSLIAPVTRIARQAAIPIKLWRQFSVTNLTVPTKMSKVTEMEKIQTSVAIRGRQARVSPSQAQSELCTNLWDNLIAVRRALPARVARRRRKVSLFVL